MSARQRNPVTRAFQILGWMAGADGDAWPLGEIAAGVAMHPATVHRVLGQLVEDGLVRQVPGTGGTGSGWSSCGLPGWRRGANRCATSPSPSCAR